MITMYERNQNASPICRISLVHSNSPVTHDELMSDPALWPKIYYSKITDHLILSGPNKAKLMSYPKN